MARRRRKAPKAPPLPWEHELPAELRKVRRLRRPKRALPEARENEAASGPPQARGKRLTEDIDQSLAERAELELDLAHTHHELEMALAGRGSEGRAS